MLWIIIAVCRKYLTHVINTLCAYMRLTRIEAKYRPQLQ